VSRSKRTRRGYTIFEVMMAIAVLTVGAAGVIALQKTTQIANTNARNLATANAIALSWVERLRMDALQWNNPNGANDLVDTRWLNMVNTSAGVWFSPTMVAGVASNRADVLGADLFPGDNAPAGFCTHVRLSNLSAGLLRAEVRTVWIRSGRVIDCDVLPNTIDVDQTLAKPIGYGAVYVTTAIINNVTPGG
jgi:prepilin-type N-terminal cleavage/methylation domain-containing protein